ncbi:MAG TPA: S1 RNA-binding domain-containing protein, partial [Trueperaceae bacterium]
TSPIRRYPDLVVHRGLRAALHHRLSPTLKERMRSDFPALAEHASERERVAEDAERDLTRYYHARWAKEHRGEAFPGVISGVTNFGIFVALPNGVEGLLHVSHLDDDYYMYLEDSMMLMGKHNRKKFRLGDRIQVKIASANPTSRLIDLIPAHMEVAEEAEAEEKPHGPAPKRLKTPLSDKSPAPEEERAERDAGGEPRQELSHGRRASSNTQPNKRVDTNAPSGRTSRQPIRDKPQQGRKAAAEKPRQAKTAQEKASPVKPRQEPKAAPAETEAPRRKKRVLVFGAHKVKP